MNYKCKCDDNYYSGYNCEFRNDAAQGVRVNLLDKNANIKSNLT